MAFVFDATVGGTSANSYLTVSAANDYFTGRYGSDRWTDLEDEAKQALLVTATKRLDQEQWSGLKASRPQSLQWPRQYMFDRDGIAIPTTTLPTRLQDAVCELAYYYLEREDATLSESDLEKFTSFEVGPLKVQTRDFKSNSLPQVVMDALQSIGYQVLSGGAGSSNSKVFVR